MEEEIARFLITTSKFEFYLISSDTKLAHTKAKGRLEIVAGINWTELAYRVETKHPFAKFDFEQSPFCIFKEASPQYLVKTESGRLKWDSDDLPIDSWERLLTRSYAQLRNNIAHGNKAHLTAQFTHDRTERFIAAGKALIDFIARQIFSDPGCPSYGSASTLAGSNIQCTPFLAAPLG